MWILRINEALCNNCGTCERLLYKFKSRYKGKLYISKPNAKRQEIMCSVQAVQDACPEQAIEYSPVSTEN